MIIILSPSKTLRQEKLEHPNPTNPLFKEKTKQLMNTLQGLSRPQLKKLMNISDNLADLNYDRNQSFETDFRSQAGEPALFTFMGDVFRGLEAEKWSHEDLEYAESRLFILSGLYGLLQPSTLVQPYRLEMGTPFKTEIAHNLYEFWGDDLTVKLNEALAKQKDKILVNLASKEYAKAVRLADLEGEVVDIRFREWRNEKWTFVSFNAKKARGTMARYIIHQQIEAKEDLKGFDLDGYGYNEELSSENELFFTK